MERKTFYRMINVSQILLLCQFYQVSFEHLTSLEIDFVIIRIIYMVSNV